MTSKDQYTRCNKFTPPTHTHTPARTHLLTHSCSMVINCRIRILTTRLPVMEGQRPHTLTDVTIHTYSRQTGPSHTKNQEQSKIFSTAAEHCRSFLIIHGCPWTLFRSGMAKRQDIYMDEFMRRHLPKKDIVHWSYEYVTIATVSLVTKSFSHHSNKLAVVMDTYIYHSNQLESLPSHHSSSTDSVKVPMPPTPHPHSHPHGNKLKLAIPSLNKYYTAWCLQSSHTIQSMHTLASW